MRRLAICALVMGVLLTVFVYSQRTADVPGVTPSPTRTPMPTYTGTATATRTLLPTATCTASATRTASHTSTITASATRTPTQTVTATPTTTPTATAAPAVAAAPPAPQASASSARVEKLVLAAYFAWYDAGGWDECNISGGDRPTQPYDSDDPSAIGRHVRTALDAGIDGFTLHWLAPGDRTDRNFATLLAQSQGTGFRSTVVFSRHFAGAPTRADIVTALRYVIDHYAANPSFLRLAGKPVIFFTDMQRVPLNAGQTPQQAWQSMRAEADPEGSVWWIAEGLDPSYLSVFDGIYVLKITHADYPDDYVKSSRWASQVRSWELSTGKTKLWLGTITPGWDDLRASCRPDMRVPSAPHRRSRDDGGFYRATFNAALASNPDLLYVYSFNEWVEGTYIEPGRLFGDMYLGLTRDFARQFKR